VEKVKIIIILFISWDCSDLLMYF